MYIQALISMVVVTACIGGGLYWRRRKARAAADDARHKQLWQDMRESMSSSSLQKSSEVVWEKMIDADRKMTDAKRKHQRQQRDEQRRRVRVFQGHEETEDTFHEWIPDPNLAYVERDAMCRENGQGTHVWHLWTCNNSQCGAYAYVAESKVDEVVVGWLEEQAPDPAKPVQMPPSAFFTYESGNGGGGSNWSSVTMAPVIWPVWAGPEVSSATNMRKIMGVDGS